LRITGNIDIFIAINVAGNLFASNRQLVSLEIGCAIAISIGFAACERFPIAVIATDDDPNDRFVKPG
jgi:hypothetical protein